MTAAPTLATQNQPAGTSARIYDPTIARFLQTDPIEGGSITAYGYIIDPINQYDLDGQWCRPKKLCKKAKQVAGGAVKVVKTVAVKSAQVTRFAVNTVVNPWSIPAAQTSGGNCGMNWSKVMIVCTSSRRWYGKGGTALGSVFITPMPYVETRILESFLRRCER